MAAAAHPFPTNLSQIAVYAIGFGQLIADAAFSSVVPVFAGTAVGDTAPPVRIIAGADTAVYFSGAFIAVTNRPVGRASATTAIPFEIAATT